MTIEKEKPSLDKTDSLSCGPIITPNDLNNFLSYSWKINKSFIFTLH